MTALHIKRYVAYPAGLLTWGRLATYPELTMTSAAIAYPAGLSVWLALLLATSERLAALRWRPVTLQVSSYRDGADKLVHNGAPRATKG